MKEFAAGCKGRKLKKCGFTVIELLVVVTILAILLILGFVGYKKHLKKARDAERKSDLQNIKVAFEDYYNDVGCYPPPEVLTNCNQPLGDEAPYYLKQIPCDPLTGEPYIFFSFNGKVCMGVRVLAALETEEDPDIKAVGCDFEDGCGWDEDEDYNYGFAIGDQMMDDSWSLGGSTELNYSYYFCVPYADGTYACSTLSYERLIDTYQCPQGFEGKPECQAACTQTYNETTHCTSRYID